MRKKKNKEKKLPSLLPFRQWLRDCHVGSLELSDLSAWETVRGGGMMLRFPRNYVYFVRVRPRASGAYRLLAMVLSIFFASFVGFSWQIFAQMRILITG